MIMIFIFWAAVTSGVVYTMLNYKDHNDTD